ncbi:MAG TPA: guanylate kinase [Thermoleophilaceae bacterium]|nr:guanylate kinase [Thermoleophilaceae bacterium]
MPHLSEQDDRRTVSAAAPRARLVPAAIGARATPILVITGPSGVGKGTLIRGLLERVGGLQLAVSATTRAPRGSEVNGVDYHFLSQEDFDRRVAAGEFVEHAVYAGNSYGTLRSELERPARGIVLEIDLQGARQVRDALPEATLVFIEPPSFAALEERLTGRASDSSEQIERRLRAASEELAAAGEFDHRVVNDDVERALKELAELAATMCEP